jgi:hypothetical protein
MQVGFLWFSEDKWSDPCSIGRGYQNSRRGLPTEKNIMTLSQGRSPICIETNREIHGLALELIEGATPQKSLPGTEQESEIDTLRFFRK